MPYILVFSRGCIGLVFFYSLISKTHGIASFKETITAYKLVPDVLVPIAAFILLSSELIIVLLLVLGGQFLSVGFLMAFVLLIIYSISLLSLKARHIVIPCNCFSLPVNRIHNVSFYDLWRNLVLLVCCISGFILRQTEMHLNFFEEITIIFIAVLFNVIILNFSSIMDFLVWESQDG